MYRRQKFCTQNMYNSDLHNPSFSSTLLDQIYRSIDDGDTKSHDSKFYSDSVSKKHTKYGRDTGGVKPYEKTEFVPHSCLIEKYRVAQKRREFEKCSQTYYDDLDHDSVLFSSTSNSSDSSSAGFSSSDTDSMFAPPPRPKPVRTNVNSRKEKSESVLFYKQRELRMIDDYHYNSAPDNTPRVEDNLIKSKSRALKIYNNLKKVKQPISPGGKLASFINSLFTNGGTKKSKNQSSSSSSFPIYEEERKLKSTCSSASSFSRSCLSKDSPSTRERLRNGVKRTVTFYPVSVVVDEDSRPNGHKFLYQQEQDSNIMSVSLPTAWKIGKSGSRRVHDEVKSHDKSRKIEREVLKDYQLNELIMKDVGRNYNSNYMEEDDDDNASCSSSDLFELDHLVVMGNNRYSEELPVYETTHLHTNRAIANGLLK